MDLFVNSHRSNKGWVKAAAGFLALVLLVFFLNLFSAPIRNFFYFISLPLQSALSSAGNNTAGIFQSVFNSKGIRQENENLKQENQRLLAEISQLCNVNEESSAVKEILATNPEKEFKLVLTSVIGLDSENDFILIDKGVEDGISENMPLISQQKVLVGKIFKVYKNFSQAMLISNKNNVLDVKVLNSDASLPPVYGAVKGKGGLAVLLDLVPSESPLNNGDVLITSALEGVYPKDLLVGKVQEKLQDDLKPFQTAKVSAFFNVRKTDKLFVIIDYKQEK